MPLNLTIPMSSGSKAVDDYLDQLYTYGLSTEQETKGGDPVPPPIDLEAFQKAALAPLKSPKEQVADGQPPGITNIALQLPVKDVEPNFRAEVQTMHDDLLAVTAVADMFGRLAKFTEYKNRNWDVTKDAALMFALDCKYAVEAMNKTLNGILIKVSEKDEEFKSSSESTELHFGFLNKVFQGFNLNQNAMEQLDTILKNTAEALGKMEFKASHESRTVDHFLRTTSIRKTNMGTKEDPVIFFVPYVTCFWFKIKAESWEFTSDKWSGKTKTRKVDFDMKFTVIETKLNTKLFEANYDKWNGMLTSISGMNAIELGKRMVPVVQQDMPKI